MIGNKPNGFFRAYFHQSIKLKMSMIIFHLVLFI